MNERVETVTIGELRYVVATLRDQDIERIARRVATMLREDDKAQRDAELEAEHRRYVPTEVIEEAARAEGGDPFPLELRNGSWRVKA
jgi:hypothetical protein